MLALKSNSKTHLKCFFHIRLGLLLYCLLSSNCYAEAIDIISTDTFKRDKNIYLDVIQDIELTEAVHIALRHGIVLEIRTQFQLYEQRLWLWDKKLTDITMAFRLEHQPLTENYLTVNMNTGGRRSYHSLDAALNYLNSLSSLPLINTNRIHEEKIYLARIRTLLDLNSLPSPMRPRVYFSEDWNISSGWHEWVMKS